MADSGIKIGFSFFHSIKEVVLRHLDAPGEVEIGETKISYENLGPHETRYELKKLLIGKRRYDVVARQTATTSIIEIDATSPHQTIRIKDNDGDGIIEGQESLEVSLNGVAVSTTPEEKGGVYRFVQQDLLAGIVEDPNLSGLARVDSLKHLTPLLAPYVKILQMILRKEPQETIQNYALCQGIRISTLRPDGKDIFDCDLRGELSVHATIRMGEGTTNLNLTPILQEETSQIRGNHGIVGEDRFRDIHFRISNLAGGSIDFVLDEISEVETVFYVFNLPDGRQMARAYFERSGNQLELKRVLLVNPRLAPLEEIPDFHNGQERNFDAVYHIPNDRKPEIITILDPSGLDWRNPFFKQKLAWNFDDPPDGFDNDRNLFVDDYIGWDFEENDNLPFDYSTSVISEAIFFMNPSDPTHFRHGTSVADVATRGTDQIKVLPMKLPRSTSSWGYDAVGWAITYAEVRKSRIVNMSFASSFPKDFERLGEVILQKPDILFIASAGNEAQDNDETPQYPASFPYENLVSVASLNKEGTDLSSFSNFGVRSVDVAAPGEAIKVVTALSEDQNNLQETYEESGTSLSAPWVANVVAKVWRIAPHLTVDQVVDLLERTVRKIPQLKEKVRWGGAVDEEVACKEALRLNDFAPPEVLKGKKGLWVVRSVRGKKIEIQWYLQKRLEKEVAPIFKRISRTLSSVPTKHRLDDARYIGFDVTEKKDLLSLRYEGDTPVIVLPRKNPTRPVVLAGFVLTLLDIPEEELGKDGRGYVRAFSNYLGDLSFFDRAAFDKILSQQKNVPKSVRKAL